MDLQTLSDHFSIPGVLAFSQTEQGLIRANITTPACTAELYLQGAQITQWQPMGQQPVLFLSERSFFTPGKAIRGGIPIVFPWFGARTATPDDPRTDGPSHGFARISEWTLSFAALAGNELHVTLTLGPSDNTRSLGYDQFALVYEITFGVELHVKLTVNNQGNKPLHFEEALHTYFSIGDSQQVSIIGLSDTEYLDKTDDYKRKRQTDPLLKLTGETDRPYLDTLVPVNIDDPILRRRITIDKAGSQTTVVWNPWSTLTATLPDMSPLCWLTMLCIETANVATNAVTLASGDHHCMEAHIFVQQFAAGYTAVDS
ncbi:MAG TPA: D-hexose-6-phosphate mutarotase [Acidobacteriaceae bacterium]|jgi:glucose-6-phosphate 1-epimerase|nr:D-hexose-6-phosphate mutarotase [Acidobacteriaceae bacterium]